MKTLLITFFAFTLFTYLSCNPKSDSKATKSVDGKAYFQFDDVEHYFLNIDEDKVWALEDKKNKSVKNIKQLDLLTEDTPLNLSDTTVLKSIEQFDFIKKQVAPNKFTQLNEIFCERKHREVWMTKCIPVYRDILVFKSNNKIVGTAKICFECDQSLISGTKQNTDEFGQSGDYGKLYKLLH